jgi:hypothetical protein
MALLHFLSTDEEMKPTQIQNSNFRSAQKACPTAKSETLSSAKRYFTRVRLVALATECDCLLPIDQWMRDAVLHDKLQKSNGRKT